MKLDLEGLFINEVVVLPDVGDLPREGLGPNAPRSHCWTSQELQVPEAALAYIRQENSPVPKNQYLRFLRALCPKVELTDVEGRFKNFPSRPYNFSGIWVRALESSRYQRSASAVSEELLGRLAAKSVPHSNANQRLCGRMEFGGTSNRMSIEIARKENCG